MEVSGVTNGGLRTRALLVGGGLLLLGMLLAAPAFACTVNADVDVSPAQAAPGTMVLATGQDFQPEMPVQLHLATDDGPLVAETETDAQGAFSVQFTVPAEARGGHTALVARQAETPGGELVTVPGADYTHGGRSAASFFVTDQQTGVDSPAVNESGVGTLPEGDVQTVPEGGFPQPEPISTTPDTEPVAMPSPVGVDEAPPAIDSEPATQPSPVTDNSTAAPVAVSQPQPAAPAPTVQQTPAVTEDAAPVSSTPAPQPVAASVAATPAATAPVAAEGPAPSTRAAFATAPATFAEATPALTPDAIAAQATPQHDLADWAAAPDAAEARGVTGTVGAGIGLLALGLVVLFAGAAVVATVRPRQTVRAERERE